MPTKHEQRLRLVLASVVTTAWAISFIVDIVVAEYDPPTSVGALMLLVSGALFGEGVIRRVKPDEDK